MIMMIIMNSFCIFSHPQEAAQRAHHLHQDTAGHPGGAVLQNPLPRHLHERGGGPEDQPARVTCSGEGEVGYS